ncbi:MAG: AF1514 family protein [Desulfobulbaceae bacterium]|nr:AF1514 family protein [Desulfobulbaceae bacterium]
MKNIELTITESPLDYASARQQAEGMAEKEFSDPMLISWCDTKKNIHSPSCLKCEIKGKQGWEVYGENHGGKLRISINEDEYVFIFG